MPLMLFYREGSEGTEKQPAQENIPTNGGTRIPTKETPLSTVPLVLMDFVLAGFFLIR